MKILVTGGCGFIGSNFIKYILSEVEDVKVINLDKKTYAGRGENLKHMGIEISERYEFVNGDICDEKLVQDVFSGFRPDIVFNFAAESHVDRSIDTRTPFVTTNILGTHVLLEAAIRNKTSLFFQISTDEVYGSLSNEDKSCLEIDAKHPRSTYSATKSAAEDLVLAAFETHGLPVIISRSANNYGDYQYPEKLLPLFITNLIDKRKVPLMWSEENPGLNIRDWLHVEDNCRAIWLLAKKGSIGEVYNIPGGNERTNIWMTKTILSCFGYGKEMIELVSHRKGHDFRYSIDGTKLKNLGFCYLHSDLEKELPQVVQWYRDNENWWRPLK
ncbi:MAG: dTDP-glucose 4,6-dehydratase [Nanoarchaeota archaeon]|nr:dTDP-glucose 4,6-dehydratase [Nanoarchaeota archaeon]